MLETGNGLFCLNPVILRHSRNFWIDFPVKPLQPSSAPSTQLPCMLQAAHCTFTYSFSIPLCLHPFPPWNSEFSHDQLQNHFWLYGSFCHLVRELTLLFWVNLGDWFVIPPSLFLIHHSGHLRDQESFPLLPSGLGSHMGSWSPSKSSSAWLKPFD